MTGLPGDRPLSEKISRMIRVDQAGESGAARIYEGQLAILKNRSCASLLEHMRTQEQAHLDLFDRLMVARRVRPTLLSPVWYGAGYALGALTALLGEKSAMACTVAVEEAIEEHYKAQEEELASHPEEAELRNILRQCREDENSHHDLALEHGAADAPAFKPMRTIIKAASKAAIWLSTRI